MDDFRNRRRFVAASNVDGNVSDEDFDDKAALLPQESQVVENIEIQEGTNNQILFFCFSKKKIMFKPSMRVFALHTCIFSLCIFLKKVCSKIVMLYPQTRTENRLGTQRSCLFAQSYCCMLLYSK